MVKEDTLVLVVPTTVAEFCELFKSAETIVNCHRDTHKNDHIRVSDWDGPNRRVAFLAPYSAPGWVKKAVGYDVVKVVERQHLEVEEDESGVKSMTMTSNPSLYVPGMGDVSIGDVCFQVSPTEDGSSCKVCTKLRCSAEKFKWLWAIRSMIEKIMLKECRIVAETFVEYCKKVAKEGVEATRAEALSKLKPLELGDNLARAAPASLSARSSEGAAAAANSARGNGGNVTARSLSRMSISSCNTVYFDANEDLVSSDYDDDESLPSGRRLGPDASPSKSLDRQLSGISVMVHAGPATAEDGFAPAAARTSHRRFDSLDELYFSNSSRSRSGLSSNRSRFEGGKAAQKTAQRSRGVRALLG